MRSVPEIRIRPLNDAPVRPDRRWVLHWMTGTRRLDRSYALQRSVERAREIDRPLVCLEALDASYPHASLRVHRFVLDGMSEHRQRLRGSRVAYHPYVEPEPGAGSGLVARLARDACLVVTDDVPVPFLERRVRGAAGQVDVRLEAVDSCGLLPLAAAEEAHGSAFTFRRFLQEELPRHLGHPPAEHPLQGAPLPAAPELPEEVLERWPPADPAVLRKNARAALADLPIDHGVEPVPGTGGARAGAEVLERFVRERLGRYHEVKEPEARAESGLSPHLHFGHVSVHDVLLAIARHERWTTDELASEPTGRRTGWWGMSPRAEAFLEQLVTWRELALNGARHSGAAEWGRWESLPEWARETLEEHASDERPAIHSREELAEAATDDELWNAAQNQLRAEGTIHGHLRKLWGKRVLTWTEHPREALEHLHHLNDRWAIDGRGPNGVANVLWVLGRYDRPFPEREIVGTVRSMTSRSTRRKLDVEAYVDRWA